MSIKLVILCDMANLKDQQQHKHEQEWDCRLQSSAQHQRSTKISLNELSRLFIVAFLLSNLLLWWCGVQFEWQVHDDMRDVRYGHLKFGCVLAPQQPHQLADWRRGLCPTDQGSVANADPVQRSHGLQGQPHLEEQHMRKIRERLRRNSSECKGTNRDTKKKISHSFTISLHQSACQGLSEISFISKNSASHCVSTWLYLARCACVPCFQKTGKKKKNPSIITNSLRRKVKSGTATVKEKVTLTSRLNRSMTHSRDRCGCVCVFD